MKKTCFPPRLIFPCISFQILARIRGLIIFGNPLRIFVITPLPLLHKKKNEVRLETKIDVIDKKNRIIDWYVDPHKLTGSITYGHTELWSISDPKRHHHEIPQQFC